MNARYRAALALLAIVIAACVPQPSQETPTPTTRATTARTKFELATYMYALQTKGKIRIAVLDKAIPFAVHDSSGLRTGFEVDLARELAKAIFGPRQDSDSVIEWIPVERTTAVSALTTAQADLTLARLAAPESGTSLDSPVDLSDPYFVTGERILIRSSNDEIKDLPDLDTKTACVQRDTAVAGHHGRASRQPKEASGRRWTKRHGRRLASAGGRVVASREVLAARRRVPMRVVEEDE